MILAELNNPIPQHRPIAGWKAVPIQDNHDEMVQLDNYAPVYILAKPQYYALKIPNAITQTWCRKGVAERLILAAQSLPSGYKFLVWDAWRPVAVQTALFEMHKAELAKTTNLTGDALDELAQKYISIPSTDPLKPSPHLTGGAIDLTIIDAAGNKLDMGTGFDYFGAAAQSDFYENITVPVKQELIVRANRRLLYNTLTNAGFTNYPDEWWHFDFGNQFWGMLTGKNAFYNKILSPQ